MEIALNECVTRDFSFHNRFPSKWVASYYGRREILALLDNEDTSEPKGDPPGPVVTPASDLEEQPKVFQDYRPSYPRHLSVKFGTRLVEVRFLIGKDGSALFPRVLSGSIPILNQLAFETISHWRFQPGMVGGQPVLTEIELPIEFISLDPSERIVDIAEVDQIPRAVNWALLEPPVLIRGTYIVEPSGDVDITFVIDQEGNVIEARPVYYTNFELADRAVDAVLRSKWEPGYQDGLPVRTRIIQRFSYRSL